MPYAGVGPSRCGLPCKNCGREDSSSWRGPGGRYCSRTQCGKAADADKAALAAGPKDERLAELEGRVDAQAEQLDAQAATIQELKQQIASLGHRLLMGKPATAARQPLGAVAPNGQPAAAPAASKKRPAAEITAARQTPPGIDPEVLERVPQGWTKRESVSQGCTVWETTPVWKNSFGEPYEGVLQMRKRPIMFADYHDEAIFRKNFTIQTALLYEVVNLMCKNEEGAHELDVVFKLLFHVVGYEMDYDREHDKKSRLYEAFRAGCKRVGRECDRELERERARHVAEGIQGACD